MRIQEKLNKWSLYNGTGAIEADLRETKRRRIHERGGKVPVSDDVANAMGASYRRWLKSIGEFVTGVIDGMQSREQETEAFAAQVAAVCGVATSALVAGGQTNASTLRRLRRLRADLRTEEEVAVREIEDALARTRTVAPPVAPSAPYPYGTRRAQSARQAAIAPPRMPGSLRFVDNNATNAAGDKTALDGVWGDRVWTDCFGITTVREGRGEKGY